MKQVLRNILERREKQRTSCSGSFRRSMPRNINKKVYNKPTHKVKIEVELPNNCFYSFPKEQIQTLIDKNNFWIDDMKIVDDGNHKPLTYITLQGEQK